MRCQIGRVHVQLIQHRWGLPHPMSIALQLISEQHCSRATMTWQITWLDGRLVKTLKGMCRTYSSAATIRSGWFRMNLLQSPFFASLVALRTSLSTTRVSVHETQQLVHRPVSWNPASTDVVTKVLARDTVLLIFSPKFLHPTYKWRFH